MTSSLALPDSIHPEWFVIHNEVDFLLSFVCPTGALLQFLGHGDEGPGDWDMV